MISGRIRNALKIPWKRTLMIMFVAQLISAVGFSSIFPFLPLYVQDLGSSTGMSIELLAGLVYSGQALTMMITSPIWGTIADRFGRKLMVERAMFSGSVILLLMAFVRSAEELVLLRTLQGLVTGTVAAANALVASMTPREHTGMSMGLLQVGQGAGIALGPILGGAIADQYGYSTAFYVTAASLLLGGILVHFSIHEVFERPAKAEKNRPGAMTHWREILSTPGVPVNYLMAFLNSFGRMLLIPILPLIIPLLLASSENINTYTGLVVGISSATTTLSSIYFGRLGDRIGHRKVLIASLTAGGLMFLPQALVRSVWQILLLQALTGVALGGIIPAYSALLARYTRPGLEGAVYGLDNAIGSGARSLAPLLGSAIALGLGLRAGFAVTGILFLISGAVGALLLPAPEKQLLVEQA